MASNTESAVPVCPKCLQPEVLAPGIDFYCPRCPVDFKEIGVLFHVATQDETQQSIHEWVKRMFPEWSGAKGRALALLEEATELGICAGLSDDEIQSAINLSLQRRSADPDPQAEYGEVADCLINTLSYAQERGIDAQAAMNEKMRKNRSRPDSYYSERTRKKSALGLQLPEAK